MGVCASNLPPPNPNEVDLSHFELLKVVGKGGFGKVNAIQKVGTTELFALKRLEKFLVLESNAHLASVWAERKIMSMINSPFLVNLLHAFESETELFLVMPFMAGGDLRYHLKERGCMTEMQMKLYAAEMLLGLQNLHEKHIVYRDLKPENCLLDAEGHIRISDFGLASILKKENGYKTTGQSGTRGYQAPEVLMDLYYGTEVDIWSFGVTIYELLHGQRPFKDWSQFTPNDDGSSLAASTLTEFEERDLRRQSQKEKNEAVTSVTRGFYISSKLSPEAHSLLRGLLNIDLKTRLGSGPRGWEDVKEHPFFKGLDWGRVLRKEYPAPIKPDTTHANCTADADLADQLLDQKPRKIPPDMQKKFDGWKFNVDIKKPEPPGSGTADAGPNHSDEKSAKNEKNEKTESTKSESAAQNRKEVTPTQSLAPVKEHSTATGAVAASSSAAVAGSISASASASVSSAAPASASSGARSSSSAAPVAAAPAAAPASASQSASLPAQPASAPTPAAAPAPAPAPATQSSEVKVEPKTEGKVEPNAEPKPESTSTAEQTATPKPAAVADNAASPGEPNTPLPAEVPARAVTPGVERVSGSSTISVDGVASASSSSSTASAAASAVSDVPTITVTAPAGVSGSLQINGDMDSSNNNLYNDGPFTEGLKLSETHVRSGSTNSIGAGEKPKEKEKGRSASVEVSAVTFTVV